MVFTAQWFLQEEIIQPASPTDRQIDRLLLDRVVIEGDQRRMVGWRGSGKSALGCLLM